MLILRWTLPNGRAMIEREVIAKAMDIPGATFPIEVTYLYRLALQAPRGTTFVELGSYKGRTLTALAYAAQERQAKLVSIDNYGYEEDSCSLLEVQQNLAKNDLGETDYIRLIEGDSRQRPVEIANVGLLFVDSCHTKAHFDAEMSTWLEAVCKDGIIACHDFNSPR